MSSAISGYFVAIRRVYKSTIIQFFEQIIKILITAFFLNLFLPKGLDFACISLILGDLISEIFSFICNFLLYKTDCKKYNTSYHTYQNYSYYNKKIFRISLPVAITSFIRSGLSTLKQILIPISFEKNKINCQNAFSIYGEINGMAMPIIIFPNIIFSSISSLFVPEFSAFNAQNRKQAIHKTTYTILKISFITSFIISLILFIFADQISYWIYKDISISHYIQKLSPICIFILIDCVIDNILKGLDAQNDVMIINIIDLIFNIIIIYTLVPKLGITGYIISMYFSEIFNLILSLQKLLKIVK